MDNLTWLTLPAEIGSLQSACSFLHQGAQAAQMSEEDCGKLDLVLEELLVNVALYAYPKGTAGAVALGYEVKETGLLFVQVCDTGAEFDPFHSDPPDFSRGLADRQVGGLGIFLVQSIPEAATYQRKGDRNVISFYLRSSK